MIKKIIVGFIIIVSIAPISFATISYNWEKRAADSLISQQFIRKAIKAKDNYEDNKPYFEIDKPLTYLLVLEIAYSDHLKKELKNVLFKKEKGKEFCVLILNLGRGDEEKMVVLRFVYDSKSEEVVGFNMGSLPEGWIALTELKTSPKLIAILDSDEDGFFFNLDNPLVSWVWADDKVYIIEDKKIEENSMHLDYQKIMENMRN